MGLTGLRLPTGYGGVGADLITAGIALEEVARYDHNCAIILCGSNITGRVLLNGSEKLKRKYLPDIAKGRCILAFAAMESEAGSDIRAIKTTAKRVKNSYVVDGEKSMITFAEVAQGYVLLVKTDIKSREGISCIFVEADRPGIDIQRLQGFGWRSHDYSEYPYSP
jgi:cyclohexanecarboxyl-CoA dehydrogenase